MVRVVGWYLRERCALGSLPADKETDMRLTHLGTTSGGGGCPELYETDRDTYVVQGTRTSGCSMTIRSA